MPKPRTAKLFKNGASQAVRLPAEFRFNGDSVYISRDERTGDVVLSDRQSTNTWHDFFEFLDTVPVSDDFMAERPMNTAPAERDVFGHDS